MNRTAIWSLLLLAALADPALADDHDLCLDTKAAVESRFAACERAIASGKWKGNDLARLLVTRAERLGRLRQLDKALEDCEAAVAADSKFAPGYRCRGAVFLERGDVDRAIAEEERALTIDPRLATAYFDRGRAYAGKHDQARARADFNEAIKINPGYAGAYNWRGMVHQQQGEHERAIEDFTEAIRLDPKFAAPLYNRSRALVRKRELDRALADADEAIRIDPRYLSGYVQRGYVLKEMHDHERARAAFDRAVEVDPKSPWPLVGRASVASLRKDYDGAIADLDAAIRLNERYALAYADRAYSYYRKGDLEQAMKDVTEALRLDPKSTSAYNHRALILHARRDYDEALADLNEALKLDPGSAVFYSNRGRTYNAKKEFDRAIKDLDESIRLNPSSSLPYWNRAISYENKRDTARALSDWKTTLRLEPGNQDAIKAIRRLEQKGTASTAATNADGKRVALVIGNADYRSGGRLSNPVNDAGDFAGVLRKLGFDVIEGRNLDRRNMEAKIAEFARKLENASVGLFFYAGHGIQVDGENWLVPVDAPIERSDLVRERAAVVKTATINVAQVVAKMEAEQRVNLIFLDACRDNPFGKGGGGNQAKGLAPIQNSIGTLTAFSTKPNHVAFDGEGRNSPFTTALLKHVPTPGLEIGAVMKRVRSDVIKSTKGEQVPFDESSLISDVVLAR